MKLPRFALHAVWYTIRWLTTGKLPSFEQQR